MNLPASMDVLPTVFTGAAGFGAGVYFLMWLLNFLGGRLDKKEAAVADGVARIDAATQRLMERMQAQIDGALARLTNVENELEECRRRDAEKLEEIARLRGIIQGFGDARQQAQQIVSSERVADRIVGKIAGAARREGKS